MTTDKLAGRKTLKVDAFLEDLEKDEIKARVDIVAVFASFSVKLVSKGKGFMGNCPWHEDKNPSLSVDREKGLYHCFGCGESGDVVSLVEKMKGVSFRDALVFLKAHTGLQGARPGGNGHAAPVRRTPPTSAEPGGDLPAVTPAVTHILDDVAERYASALQADLEARAYLASRGLDRGDLVKRFSIGYSAGTLSSALGQAQKTELTRLGILSGSGREHFAHCLTFPLLDGEGRVVGFYGRRIKPAETPAHLYLPGPHRGLVNRAGAHVYNERIVLTESVIDALSLIALGVESAIPCYGVNGFTAEHEKLLETERVKEVVIGFDADEAGRRGAEALRERIQAAGRVVRVIAPPRGKDWNEYLCGGETAAELKGLFEATPAAESDPEKPASENPLTVTVEGERKVFSFPAVRYRVAGARELFVASLRVNIRAEAEGKTAIDNVDLYSARSRAAFAAGLSQLCGLQAPRVERDLVAILDWLEAERDKKLSSAESPAWTMGEGERSEGMELLRDPALMERVLTDLDALGYVGEEENKLLVYLAATSRRMEDPLSVLIVSESASGKSLLIETVKRLMPPEETVAMTSLSDQALQYLGEEALLAKFLVMGEAVHSPAVEHQVREMLSSRELSRLVTLKDERTGELSTRLVRKRVVVSCALSTTNSALNPENASRFFVVGADESEEQTRAIFERQKGKYSIARYRADRAAEEVERRHRAAQRLLVPRAIVNPFAPLLDFPSRLMRSRRDHARFLDLIAAVCFLRQYLKRERDEEGVRTIACDIEDYRIAYRVMRRVLAATYGALPQQAQGVYEALRALARRKAAGEGVGVEEARVSQREIREEAGIAAMTVKRGVRQLCDYEYLVAEGSGQRGARRAYRLVRDEGSAELSASIPTPEEVERKLKNLESGSTGSEWVWSGSNPLSRA